MMGPHAAEREVVKMASVSAISQPHLRAVWAPSESDELLRLAIQVGGIGIFESDLIQKRTRFSPELCAILGIPVGTEMPYEEASRLIDERDRAAVQANAEVAAKSADRGKWNGVWRVVRADGAVRWVSVHGRRLYRDTRQWSRASAFDGRSHRHHPSQGNRGRTP